MDEISIETNLYVVKELLDFSRRLNWIPYRINLLRHEGLVAT